MSCFATAGIDAAIVGGGWQETNRDLRVMSRSGAVSATAARCREVPLTWGYVSSLVTGGDAGSGP